MPGFLTSFGIKDYVIAALSAALITLAALCFVSVSLPFGITLEGWRPWGLRMERERDAVIAAQKTAGEAQKAVNTTEQDRLDTAAKGSEHEKPLIDTAVRAAVAEYARNHRLPEGASCASGGTDTAAEGDAAGVVESLPAPAGVAISERDLSLLTDAAGYALACRSWALEVSGN
jgi:hypothetical protein